MQKGKTNMNKIGALLGYGTATDIRQSFAKFQELGLNCCQLSVWDVENMFTPEKAKAARDAADEYGIEITALWAGWTGPSVWNFTEGPQTLGIVPPEYREMRVQQLIRAADFADWLGVTDIITHAGFLPENPGSPEYQPVLDAIRLDTANLILYGKANTVDALEVFGKYVRNTHFKDGLYPTCGSELGREVPLGEGRANVPGIVKKLKELGYTGPFVIEREISGDQQIADIAKAKALLEQSWANA